MYSSKSTEFDLQIGSIPGSVDRNIESLNPLMHMQDASLQPDVHLVHCISHGNDRQFIGIINTITPALAQQPWPTYFSPFA